MKTKKITFIFLIFTFVILPALDSNADNDFYSLLKQKTRDYYPEAVKIRRCLHQFPEPCFKENITAQFIADYLNKLGFKVQTGIAGTGIKAILEGGAQQPVVGIRADMDALPILETTGFAFASQNKGFMHACGHDAHITNVLIAARILSECRDKVPGTIVFLFQPCEEGTPDGSPSGADQMKAAGALDNPKIGAMVGLHVMPGYPAGQVALREGPLMANVASVFITIHGKASHGALPHQGVDAIYAASTAIVQFQSLISRSKDPNERAVLTIGTIKGGVRLNVIADKVEMEGTVRTFSFDTQDKIRQGMENILKGLSIAAGITYDYRFEKTNMFVNNDPPLTRRVIPVFRQLLGEDNVRETEPLTIGEDFAVYSHTVPSVLFFLGAGEKGALHTPDFSVAEDSFNYGPLLLATAALESLEFLKAQK